MCYAGKQREVYEKMKIDNDYGAIDINCRGIRYCFPFSKPDEEVEERRTVTSYISGDNFWTHFTNNKTNPKQLYEWQKLNHLMHVIFIHTQILLIIQLK